MQDILKNRILNAIGLIIIYSLSMACGRLAPSKPNILLITGGHSFDTAEFFDLFESLDEFDIDTLSQPYANELIGLDKARKYDALVFYDFWQTISETEKKAYLELTESGKGLLFLHHSLVSYTGWDEFTKMRGGIYPVSNPPDSINDGKYRHDIDLLINIYDNKHPVTLGIGDFMIHDEGYSNIRLAEGITPLLKTSHPDCAEMFGWTHTYKNSKIVYLMGGHDKLAYANENYKELIRNSLNFIMRLN